MANVIVTGGAGALGSFVISELVERGHRVASMDLASGLADNAAELALPGVDLTNEDAVAQAFGEVARIFGSIDGLANVAGGFVWEPVSTGALQSWDRMYRVNVLTTLISSRNALPYFGSSGGAIVNMGAASAIQPGLGMAPYAAAKAGVHALTQSLAEELRPRKIRVNAILPTIIDTPANRRDMPTADQANWVSPESIARVIAFLLSEEGSCITAATVPVSMTG